MLLIRTSVGRSQFGGLGLFTAEDVPARTIVWQKHPLNPLTFSEEELQALPRQARETVLFYGFMDYETGRYQLDIDNARFMNHEEFPNIFSSRNGRDMLARVDLPKGTELTINYRRVDKMSSPEEIHRFPHRQFLLDIPDQFPGRRLVDKDYEKDWA